MKKEIIFVAVFLIFLIGAGMFYFSNSSSEFTGQVREFDMVARNWEFLPNEIRVNQGDKVILNIISEDIPHGIYISDYGINERINPGEETRIEFIASKDGEFIFGCSVPCGMGHRGMVGRLIVE